MGAVPIPSNTVVECSVKPDLSVSRGIECDSVGSSFCEQAGIPIYRGVAEEAIVVICTFVENEI